MGFFDLSRNAVVSGLNNRDATIWNDLMFYEASSGKVVISQVKYDESTKVLRSTVQQTIDIPVGPLGRIYAAELSDNQQWLALSSRTRGAIWDLQSGERKMHLRGFRGAILSDAGRGLGEFPKQEPVNHSLVLLDPKVNVTEPFREIPDKGARMYGRFVLIRQRLKDSKKKENEKPSNMSSQTESDESGLRREVRFELRDAVDDKVVWSREFPKEAPGFFFDAYSGRLIFYWDLGSEVGKSKLKDDAALAQRARQMGNKDDDYLIEVVDSFAAKTVANLLLETGNGSIEVKNAYSEGDWLVVHDSNNRVLAYSLKDGDLRHRFFGTRAVVSPAGNQILVENYPGEFVFYDLVTGSAKKRLVFGSPSAFARFSLNGKKLLVLTTAQTAYAFDVNKLQ